MKTFKEFNNRINEDRTAPFDALLTGLKKMNIASDFKGRLYEDIHNDDNEFVYEITAEIRVSSDYTSIEGFKSTLENIDSFMKENFNFNRSNISNALRNGNIALIYSMTLKELETSKGFIPYITVYKYDL